MNTVSKARCQVPIGSYAGKLIDGEIWLRALVGAPDGSRRLFRGERAVRHKMPNK